LNRKKYNAGAVMSAVIHGVNTTTSLAYPADYGSRDLRIDYLRGLIMLVVITVHMEYYSAYGLLVWERIGLVSSAEGFVFLSGLVLGIVYRKRITNEGIWSAAKKLWQRAFLLYRVNVVVILSIALLGLLPHVDVFEVTHWAIPETRDQIFPLYPPASASWLEIIRQALLLKIGPHQFQVIGLYVLLIGMAPMILYALHRKQTLVLVLLSWMLYGLNQFYSLKLTGARFEYAFPSLTWQLLFINGIAVGYHRHIILDYLADQRNNLLLSLVVTVSLVFILLSLNRPNALFWPWETWSYIDAGTFNYLYMTWFQKSALGLGRVINNIILFILFYYLLSHYWQIFSKSFGWLFIPLGQASLYVFIVHVYFILLFSNTPLPAFDNFYINTMMHTATILLIWLMVKRKFLFNLIPR
jgi:hypothetical protein